MKYYKYTDGDKVLLFSEKCRNEYVIFNGSDILIGEYISNFKNAENGFLKLMYEELESLVEMEHNQFKDEIKLFCDNFIRDGEENFKNTGNSRLLTIYGNLSGVTGIQLVSKTRKEKEDE